MNSYNVGDILYTSWGYEQTNVDFYRVVSVSAKGTVKLEKLHKWVKDDGHASMSGYATPADRADTSEKAFNRRPSRSGYMKVTSYSYLYKWDGAPKRVSWYG